MATAERVRSEVAFDSSALELLDCFTNGFDEILSRMAAHVAESRGKAGSGVLITASDIKQSADEFAKIMKAAELPADVKQEVDEMLMRLAVKRQHGK